MKSRTLLRARGHAVAIVAYRNSKFEHLLRQSIRLLAKKDRRQAGELASEASEWSKPWVTGRHGKINHRQPSY